MTQKYDPSYRYNLMIVTDYEAGPEETIPNLSAEDVLAAIRERRLPEHAIFIEDAATGKLCGLKYAQEPCLVCGTLTSNRVDWEVEDPYGVACSEPELGVPLTMTVQEPCCPKCAAGGEEVDHA